MLKPNKNFEGVNSIMRCFNLNCKNEDELILMLKEGKFDKEIFDYLIEVMVEEEGKVLRYPPTELFEIQSDLSERDELLHLQFWDIDNSGISVGFRVTINDKQRELFDLFVTRINEIYKTLIKLVS